MHKSIRLCIKVLFDRFKCKLGCYVMLLSVLPILYKTCDRN